MTARGAGRYAGTRARRIVTPAERRAELDLQFAIRTAEDVAAELGEMKGVLMKVGQMVSFIAEGPARRGAAGARRAPSRRRSDGAVARRVGDPRGARRRPGAGVRHVGRPAGRRGEHRPGAPGRPTVDGRQLAVKVQFPGVSEAIEEDLDAAEVMYAMFSALALNGLDARALVDELRARMREELDYRREAANLAEFAAHFAGHPWVRIPEVVPEPCRPGASSPPSGSTGSSWDQFMATAPPATKQRAAEVIWRFAQHSVHRLGVFNGDPHPGNYRFHHDGSVTFLDFGLVKRWERGRVGAPRAERSTPSSCTRDPDELVTAMETAGFLAPDHGLDPQRIYDYVSLPVPAVPHRRVHVHAGVDALHARPGSSTSAARTRDVIAALNMPASFVILDRVVWGVSAILGKLGATGPWRAMLLEYRIGAPPATELGAAELAWRS